MRLGNRTLLASLSLTLGLVLSGCGGTVSDQDGNVVGTFTVDQSALDQLANAGGTANAAAAGGGGASGGCGGQGEDLTPAAPSPAAPQPPNNNQPGSDANLGTLGQTTDPDVQTAIARLESEYNVPIRGQWNLQTIGSLEVTLSYYRHNTQLLRGLDHITMQENGGEDEAQGVGAYFARRGNEMFIVAYGRPQNFGQGQQTIPDVLQHEIGHYMTLTAAVDRQFPQTFKNAVLSGPDISRYGTNQRPDEKTAEWWGKMLTPSNSPRFVPPLRSFRTNAQSMQVANQVMPGPYNPDFQ